MAEPRPLRPNDPREIGGYRLTGRVGEGAQGTVYLGENGDGEQVAVKVLRAGIDGDERARTLFDRELSAARRVAPFCTARVLDAEASGETPYIVSEYIDGPSLRELIAGRGPLPEPELRRLAIGTATALAAIHEAGVVHRDFKPANVLLGPDGPKVIDFGVARPLEATSATLTGAVGTPAYMAPEQVSGAAGGPPLDMFAWGCTMAYAANGAPPFGADTVPAIMHRVLYAPPALGVLAAGGPAGELGALVAACLEKDPARRPTALQLLVGLLGDGHDEDLLAEGTSAAATLTATALPEPAAFPPPPPLPPPVPVGPMPMPGPMPGGTQPGMPGGTSPLLSPDMSSGPVPSYRTAPAAPAKGNRALLIAGAVAAVVVLAAGTTTAAILLKDDGNGGTPSTDQTTGAAEARRTAGTGGATGGGGAGTSGARCDYSSRLTTPSPSTVTDVGTPPATAALTGTVHATMKTNLGTLSMDLDASKAPCTVNSLAYLAGKKFYDASPCHRLTSDASLKVLQCGDPSGTGTGGPNYRFPDENLDAAAYTRGTVAMANAGPGTNGSQFFILYADAPSLPKSYTVFGHVTSGMEIVDKVAGAGSQPAGDGKPKQKITIESFTVPAS